MRRLGAVLCVLIVGALTHCDGVHASGATLAYLNCGLGLSPVPQHYNGSVRLPSTSFAMQGGIARRLSPSVCGSLDLEYFRFGEGASMDAWAGTIPVVESSTALTAMVGLRFEAKKDGVAPFLVSSAGVGHVMVGDFKFEPGRTIPGARFTAPAFAIGAGVRMGSSTSRVRPSVGMHWLNVLTSDEVTNILPIVIGLTF